MKTLSRRFVVVAILVVALAAIGLGVAVAQSITYQSSYQLQNLDSSPATVSLQYYDQGTGNLAASGTITIAGNGSKTIFPFVCGPFGDCISGPATFNGSLVVSSDKQIAAILNTQTTSLPFYGDSTDGFSAGSTSMSLPLIMCNNSGFNTWFNVQNAGSSDATITINYIPGVNGTSGVSEGATIKPGAAKTFNQTAGSATKNCNNLKDASGRFIGSASITSNQPVVASVMQLGTGSVKTLQGYDGFVAGSTTVNLPLIMSNNSNYYTSINMQNAGTNPTNVTVTFKPNTIGNTNTPNAESFTLNPGQSKVLIQSGGISAFSPHNNWNAFGKYVSGATISQTGSEPLVAIINQNNTALTSLGSSYAGFNPGSATGTIKLPLIASNNSGYNTSINLQVLSGPATVTVNYGTNTGGGTLTNPLPDTKTLNAGQTWVLIQSGVPGPLTGVNNWSTAGRYVGSATVNVTGGTAVAIVNYTGPINGGDTFFAYNGFNVP